MRSYFSIALACAFAAFSVLLQPAIGAEADSKIQDIAETIKSAVEAAADMPKLIQSAEAGDVKSQMTLGVLYDYGLGVPQDKEEAFKWYLKAAEQGHANSQYSMGRLYSEGKGVPQDDKETVKWYRKAAEQGKDGAQLQLGYAYYEGKGVPQDYKETFNWYLYEDGDGVLQDFVQAHAWFNVASANGSVAASELRDEVANQMTPEQIAKAQELAKEYFEKYQPEK